MGFSVGAAIGLKLIENLKGVSMGIFFYGYPLAKSLEPRKLHCPIVIFHA
jgi:dienelactone hydrolase